LVIGNPSRNDNGADLMRFQKLIKILKPFNLHLLTSAAVPETFDQAIEESYADFAVWLAITNGNYKRGEISARYLGDLGINLRRDSLL
jgi:hypothetical protein